jgi:hypothetical protein
MIEVSEAYVEWAAGRLSSPGLSSPVATGWLAGWLAATTGRARAWGGGERERFVEWEARQNMHGNPASGGSRSRLFPPEVTSSHHPEQLPPRRSTSTSATSRCAAGAPATCCRCGVRCALQPVVLTGISLRDVCSCHTILRAQRTRVDRPQHVLLPERRPVGPQVQRRAPWRASAAWRPPHLPAAARGMDLPGGVAELRRLGGSELRQGGLPVPSPKHISVATAILLNWLAEIYLRF